MAFNVIRFADNVDIKRFFTASLNPMRSLPSQRPRGCHPYSGGAPLP